MVATSNFSPDEKLGSGGFSNVYLGYISGTKVAVNKFTEVNSCILLRIVLFKIILCPQEGSVAKAMKEGIRIPDIFKIDGQLNCEAHALTR